MKQIVINPKEDLIFDLKVREMCKSCKRYGKKATCPPYIESVGYYSRVLSSYSCGVIYYEVFSAGGNAKEVGKASSLKIYKKITSERNKLFAKGHYLIIGFGAGSCKLCDDCSFPCPKPAEALIPIEATGIDVVKAMRKFNVDVKFPVNQTVCRVGAIFYD